MRRGARPGGTAGDDKEQRKRMDAALRAGSTEGQVGLTFGPELLVVRTGQPVDFRNSDDTLHNVNVKHEETREQAFNVAIPTGATYEHTFTRDGFYRVGCDIHPAMAASIFATSSPFAAVAESDGRFAFVDIPAGAWTVTVYPGGRQLRKTD